MKKYHEEFEKETGRKYFMKECDYCGENYKYTEWLEQRLASAEDKLRWIPVKERLPNKPDAYLVKAKCRNGMKTTRVCVYSKLWTPFWDIIEITHWLPIPEMKEEE